MILCFVSSFCCFFPPCFLFLNFVSSLSPLSFLFSPYPSLSLALFRLLICIISLTLVLSKGHPQQKRSPSLWHLPLIFSSNPFPNGPSYCLQHAWGYIAPASSVPSLSHRNYHLLQHSGTEKSGVTFQAHCIKASSLPKVVGQVEHNSYYHIKIYI